MKRIITVLTVAALAAFGLSAPPAQGVAPTHHGPSEAMQTVLPGQAMASVIGDLARPEFQPEYATNCQHFIRPTKTSAVANCYNYSGSGNYKFQVAALAFDGCNRWIWIYGNVGWPYIRYKTTTAKWSYAYTPAGIYWRFVRSYVLVWKP